jgi:CRP-like cAMP-binding protein
VPAAPAAKAAAGGNLVTVMDGFEFLKSAPLFKDLSLDELKAVYHSCETKVFAAGQVLIEQDRPGEALFVLRKGTARVLRTNSDGSEEQVARLGPGSPAGEMGLVDDSPTSAKVLAETEVQAFSIDRLRFEKLMASSDRMAVKLYRLFALTLAKRLRQTSQVLAANTRSKG